MNDYMVTLLEGVLSVYSQGVSSNLRGEQPPPRGVDKILTESTTRRRRRYFSNSGILCITDRYFGTRLRSFEVRHTQELVPEGSVAITLSSRLSIYGPMTAGRSPSVVYHTYTATACHFFVQPV